MKYLFILGRNLQLSIVEIFSFCKRKDIEVKSYLIKNNGFLLETDKELPENTIDCLGGTISFGKVIAEGKLKDVTKKLDSIMIYLGTSNKLNYALWNFAEESYEDIQTYLKYRFKEEKLKATEKRISNLIKMQDGKEVLNINSSKLIGEEYFVFEDKKEVYFGKIEKKCDYEQLEKRDMEKPVRRNELAISPRLAKIMVNLSEIKDNEILLDPFCGIGVVLQEALLQDLDVVGIDFDKEAIEGCKKNLAFMNFPRNKYLVFNNDSRKARIEKANVLVAEPDLGKILKKVPTKEEAQETMRAFENLMISVIRNFREKLTGKIVFTSPLIQLHQKRLSCDINRILEETGYKLAELDGISFPIPEYRESQIVGRNIFVLEK